MNRIESYNVDDEREADEVLASMKTKSMDDVEAFAQRNIKDGKVRAYFLNKARTERS